MRPWSLLDLCRVFFVKHSFFKLLCVKAQLFICGHQGNSHYLSEACSTRHKYAAIPQSLSCFMQAQLSSAFKSRNLYSIVFVYSRKVRDRLFIRRSQLSVFLTWGSKVQKAWMRNMQFSGWTGGILADSAWPPRQFSSNHSSLWQWCLSDDGIAWQYNDLRHLRTDR